MGDARFDGDLPQDIPGQFAPATDNMGSAERQHTGAIWPDAVL